ncbi:uncharacterized protein LOC122062071 [Macadamia integrifolia]|uniref:uncharacterized protein LOC122062071 n=1 Tax=Macadamia integrifolia TaxID=60698 RepID=UPI001C527559|nr:uncharacterized protein LOC122062071 [Macadamia integrifolia]
MQEKFDWKRRRRNNLEEFKSQKPLANRERILDLQFDLEKPDKDGGTGSVSGSKQQPKTATRHDSKTEKIAQSTSLPLANSIILCTGTRIVLLKLGDKSDYHTFWAAPPRGSDYHTFKQGRQGHLLPLKAS